MQDDDRAMLRLETSQCPVELVAQGECLGRIGQSDEPRWVELDFGHATTPSTRQVETGMNGQSMEPGIEPVRVAKPGQIPPGADEGFLDRVAGKLAVPEDQPRSRVETGDRRARKRGEGVMIAPPRSLDEFPLIHVAAPELARHIRSHSTRYGAPVSTIVPSKLRCC